MQCMFSEKKIVRFFKAINFDHASKSIKLLDFRNTEFDLRGTDILKLPKVNITTYRLKSWETSVNTVNGHILKSQAV